VVVTDQLLPFIQPLVSGLWVAAVEVQLLPQTPTSLVAELSQAAAAGQPTALPLAHLPVMDSAHRILVKSEE
jgi:hypothetical protein